MTKTSEWPFGTDAKQDDPLTALRIPVVSSPQPEWRYVAAYLDTAEPNAPDYLAGPPFASVERPTDREAQMLVSFLQEHRHYWFGNQGYAREMDARPLDIDSGWNTVVFVKYGEDDWGYGRVSWSYGHTFVPTGPKARGTQYAHAKHPGPLPLERVMDLVHAIGSSKPMERWTNWKAAHPEVFGPADGQDQVVAFTVGSLWFCPDCAQTQPVRMPARRRDLMDAYTYHCDQCRKPIR